MYYLSKVDFKDIFIDTCFNVIAYKYISIKEFNFL